MMKAIRFMLLITLLFGVGQLSALQNKPVLIRFDEHSLVGLSAQRGAHLDVRVEKAELEDILKLYTAEFSSKRFPFGKHQVKKLSSKRAIVPYLALSPGFKRAFLKKLWPDDHVKGDYLVHKVTYNNETLWTVAQMYTGFGNNYKAIKRASNLRRDSLRRGMQLKIPHNLLMDLLKEELATHFPDPEAPAPPTEVPVEEATITEETTVPVVSAPGSQESDKPAQESKKVEAEPKPPEKKSEPAKTTPTPPNTADAKGNREEIRNQLAVLEDARAKLRYGSDRKGRYAEYRLERGEAIYTAVVVRYCGMVRAKDVNHLSKQIIDRNNIRDVRDMPVGQRIRIPYEYLDSEYKALDDPEYLEFVRNLEEVAEISTNVVANNLEGVHIILDSGHGGRDPGADRSRVWEDDFVYDIVCRVKARLEKESSAVVYTTVLDPSVQYKVQDVNRFRRDDDEVLLTKPNYKLSNRRVNTDGVNLRWMLANRFYKELVDKGAKPDHIVFASFHADALHPSIRGSMVYVPDGRHFPSKVTPPGNLTRYQEAKTSHFRFSRRTVQRAQATSLSFANKYIKESREAGIRIHRQKPIRSLIYRNPTKPFVPAVLRFNRVPTRVLIEVCNLSNRKDQDLLKRPDFRQRVADAFVDAVYATYHVPSARAGSRPTESGARGGK